MGKRIAPQGGCVEFPRGSGAQKASAVDRTKRFRLDVNTERQNPVETLLKSQVTRECGQNRPKLIVDSGPEFRPQFWFL